MFAPQKYWISFLSYGQASAGECLSTRHLSDTRDLQEVILFIHKMQYFYKCIFLTTIVKHLEIPILFSRCQPTLFLDDNSHHVTFKAMSRTTPFVIRVRVIPDKFFRKLLDNDLKCVKHILWNLFSYSYFRCQKQKVFLWVTMFLIFNALLG